MSEFNISEKKATVEMKLFWKIVRKPVFKFCRFINWLGFRSDAKTIAIKFVKKGIKLGDHKDA